MTKSGSDYLKLYSIIFFSVLIVGYFIFNFRVFIAGPEIIITSPQNGETTDKDLVEVTGKAENVNFISINDRSIFLDENGNFKEFLLLSSGYNIIVIKAQDKFKRSISKNLEIIYQGNSVSHTDVINMENSLATSTNSGTSTLQNNEASSTVKTNSE
jgi:hypothetical protein